jgi:hypothetical protein
MACAYCIVPLDLDLSARYCRFSPSQVACGAVQVANLPTLDRAFWSVVDHPRVMPIIDHYLGNDCILGSLSSRVVRPGDPVQVQLIVGVQWRYLASHSRCHTV